MKTYRIRHPLALSICLLALTLAACSQHDTPATEPQPAPSAAVEPIIPIVPDNLDQLRERAEQAMRENRLYAPASDNAIEYFLAARERQPDDARSAAALVELQPYLLIATEQMLERGDLEQSQQLLQLLTRVDTQAPALPRLQAALEQLQRSSDTSPEPGTATDSRAVVATAVAGPTQGRSAASASPASTPATATADPAALPAPIPEPETVQSAPSTTSPPTPTPQAPAAPDPRPASIAASSRTAMPRLLQDAQPRYPLPALRSGIEGSVEVAFDIQPDGSVRNVQMLSATPKGVFDASALAVATRWRFEPSGQSHRSQRTVRFRLPD
jgi:periplasmic protein TonB